MLTPLLFEPITINGLRIPNRLTMPPMHSNLGSSSEGITEKGIDFYVARAKGGFGLIGVGVIDAYFIDHAGSPDELFLDNDIHIKRYTQLVNRLKQEGTVAYAQIGVRRLFHVSRLHREKANDRPSLSEINAADIEEMIAAVVSTSVRAAEAGFQAIDILGVGGSGHSLFTSQVFNDRTDKWGGSQENRIRFSVETVRGIKKALGEDFPVFYRLHGSEFLPGGYGIEGAKYNAAALERAGVCFFNVTGGGHATSVPQLTPNVPRGAYAYLAREIKKEVKSAFVAASNRNNHPFEAEQILREGKADMISLARQALADPDWPKKVRDGKIYDVRHCIACNECMDVVVIHNKPIRCLVNPRVGVVSEVEPVRPADIKRKVVVVGGGVAGLQFALTAAERGHKVTVIEKNKYLGGMWHQASAPHGRDQLFTFLEWLVNQCNKAGVYFEMDTEATPELVKALSADIVVVSPGSSQHGATIPGSELAHVYPAIDAFNSATVIGERVVVIGGGGIGLEVALYLAARSQPSSDVREFLQLYAACSEGEFDVIGKRAHQVTLISRQKRLGGTIGGSTRWVLQKEASLLGVDAVTSSVAKIITSEGVIVENQRDELLIPADTVFLATGLQPNTELFDSLVRSKVADEIKLIGSPEEAMHAIASVSQAYRLALSV